MHYLEDHKLEKDSADASDLGKLKEWLSQQLISFQQLLCTLIKTGEPEMQASSVRTMMEVSHSLLFTLLVDVFL